MYVPDGSDRAAAGFQWPATSDMRRDVSDGPRSITLSTANDSTVTAAGAESRSTVRPCIRNVGAIAAAVAESNAYANGSVLVSVDAKLAITGMRTSLMIPVRWRLPMPASRLVESV